MLVATRERRGLRGVGPSDLGSFPLDAVRSATASAEAWFGRALSIPTPTDMLVALWRLAQSNADLEIIRQKMISINRSGLLTSKDVQVFEDLRSRKLSVETSLFTPVVSQIRRVNPSIANQLPSPSKGKSLSDPVTPEDNFWVPSQQEFDAILRGDFSGPVLSQVRESVESVFGLRRGVRGLGFDPITITVAGVTVAIPVAVILLVLASILILIVAIAAMVILGPEIEAILLYHEQIRAEREALGRRETYVRDCTSRGGNQAECARQAVSLYPEPPRPPNPSNPTDWLWPVAVLSIVGVGGYIYYRERGRRG